MRWLVSKLQVKGLLSMDCEGDCAVLPTIPIVTYDFKMTFSNNYQETLKKVKVYYLQDLEFTQPT